ncbi:MAG: response regulator [Deferrisomatales bacterium]|nr:response regulator [Deferrisomatales bacterium]
MDVLLIDDEKGIRDALAAFLHSQGHVVREATRGEEGLWLLETRPADLVITDIRMPGLTGIDVLRQVRERWPGVEVVLVTGFGTLDDAVEALRLGAYDFLIKPLRLAHLEVLLRRVEERLRYSRDNRELREVVERLKDLNDRKEKFIAIANHEIRTPTTVAAGLVSLLAGSGTGLPEEQRRLLEVADRALRRLKEIVEDLGDLGSGGPAGMRVQPAPYTVGELARDIDGLCEMYRSLRELAVGSTCRCPEAESVWVDGRKLLRAVGALLQNAVKFTPDGGRVAVQIGTETGALVVEVSDTGVGVPEEERAKIFELFYASEDVRHHRTSGHAFGGGGLGIGLPLARAIARAHGGEIGYAPRPGGGSLFSIRVPAVAPA